MTLAAAPRDQTTGVIAALVAFWLQLVDIVRGVAGWREQGQRLAGYETRLVHALCGGGLRNDPAFIALPQQQQRAMRRRLARDLAEVRRIRIIRHQVDTRHGKGYRRKPFSHMRIRFERRTASCRTRRLGRTRLAFVASPREALAGAPP
jgi:hypothetical protein